jgi:hypothetical protein
MCDKPNGMDSSSMKRVQEFCESVKMRAITISIELENLSKTLHNVIGLVDSISRNLKNCVSEDSTSQTAVKVSRPIERPQTSTCNNTNEDDPKDYIPTPEWLNNRGGGIINIKADKSLLRSIHLHLRYKALKVRDAVHDFSEINSWFKENNVDISMLIGRDVDVNQEALRDFERKNKLQVYVFLIDERGPEFTRTLYLSILNDKPLPSYRKNAEKTEPDRRKMPIYLGYLRENDKRHFVYINKINCIFTRRNCTISGNKYMCQKCKEYFVFQEFLDHRRQCYDC